MVPAERCGGSGMTRIKTGDAPAHLANNSSSRWHVHGKTGRKQEAAAPAAFTWPLPRCAGCRGQEDTNSLLRTHVLEWVNIGVASFCLPAMLLTCALFGRRVWVAVRSVRDGGALPLAPRKRYALVLTCVELALHTLNLCCYLAMNIYSVKVRGQGAGNVKRLEGRRKQSQADSTRAWVGGTPLFGTQSFPTCIIYKHRLAAPGMCPPPPPTRRCAAAGSTLQWMRCPSSGKDEAGRPAGRHAEQEGGERGAAALQAAWAGFLHPTSLLHLGCSFTIWNTLLSLNVTRPLLLLPRGSWRRARERWAARGPLCRWLATACCSAGCCCYCCCDAAWCGGGAARRPGLGGRKEEEEAEADPEQPPQPLAFDRSFSLAPGKPLLASAHPAPQQAR